MMKIKRGMAALMLFTLGLTLHSEEIVRTELETVSEKSIEFENYEGPYSVVNTRDQIWGIGEYLAQDLNAGGGTRGSYWGLFTLYRTAEADSPGYNADILVMESTSGVDHIRNLRLILTGYLETMYEYERRDAELLSRFITVYNAVYRRDIAYVTEHYNDKVVELLDEDSIGLARSYREWPGATQILIPLTGKGAAGEKGLGSLDSDALTDDAVIEEMREEEDRGLEDRKEMVEMKEREIDEEQEAIEEEREELAQQEEEVTERRESLEEEREELEAQPDSEEKEEQIAAVEEEIQEAEEEQQAVEEKKEELAAREEEQAERVEKVQDEREEIARDQRELIEEREEEPEEEAAAEEAPEAVPAENPVLFLKNESSAGDFAGRLLLIDINTGRLLKQSAVNTLRSRHFVSFQSGLLAVGGSEGGDRIISLMLLDQEALTVLKSATVEVYPQSTIMTEGGKIYAVVKEGRSWQVGVFNSDLVLESISRKSVMPMTALSVRDDKVIAQGEAGQIMVFAQEDFKAP